MTRSRILVPLFVAAAVPAGAFAAATSVGMPNPASVFCGDVGGQLQVVSGSGGQYGLCQLPDGSSEEEWQLFRSAPFDVVSVVSPAKNGSTDVDAKYPKFHDAALAYLNGAVSWFVHAGIRETQQSANVAGSAGSQATSYSSAFEAYASTGTVSAVIRTEEYTGGAHPIDDIRTFLSTKGGKPLTFRRFLLSDPASLQEFAFRTQLELLDKYKSLNLGKKAVVDATDAKWSNFAHVAIDGDSALVYFPTYTLGTRVDGSQVVRVSLAGIATADSGK